MDDAWRLGDKMWNSIQLDLYWTKIGKLDQLQSGSSTWTKKDRNQNRGNPIISAFGMRSRRTGQHRLLKAGMNGHWLLEPLQWPTLSIVESWFSLKSTSLNPLHLLWLITIETIPYLPSFSSLSLVTFVSPWLSATAQDPSFLKMLHVLYFFDILRPCPALAQSLVCFLSCIWSDLKFIYCYDILFKLDILCALHKNNL